MVVNGAGGIYNRAGLRFVGRIKNQQQGAKLFLFKFNVNDTYILEMGERYVRFIRNDQYVIDEGTSIPFGMLEASGSKLIGTLGPYSFVTGDDVFVFGVPGVREVNGRMFNLRRISSTQVELRNQSDDTSINASSYSGLPASGGEIVKVYELETPYNFEDLDNLRYSQVGDVVTFTKFGRSVREMRRKAHDNWVITIPGFGTSIEKAPVERHNKQRLYNLSLGVCNVGGASQGDVNVDPGEVRILDNFSPPQGTGGVNNEVDIVVLYDGDTGHIATQTNGGLLLVSGIDDPGLPGFSAVGYEIDRIYNDINNKLNIVWSTNGLVPVGIPSSSLTNGFISNISASTLGYYASYLQGSVSFPGLRVGDPICLDGFTYQGDQTAAFFDQLQHCEYIISSINNNTRTIKLDLEILGKNVDLSLLGLANAKIYIPFLRIPFTPRDSITNRIVLTSLVNNFAGKIQGYRIYARPKSATNYRLVDAYSKFYSGGSFTIPNPVLFSLILNGIRADNPNFINSNADSNDVEPFLQLDNTASLGGANSIGFAPSTVGFYKQRRVFGGSKDAPDKLFYSGIGDYYNFVDLTRVEAAAPNVTPPVLNADDPFSATLAANTVDAIQHIVPLDELLVLTDNLQWQVQPVSGSAFSLITADHRPRQYIGASRVPPLVLDDTVIFIRKGGREVIGLGYSGDKEGYVPVDISLLSKHLFKDSLITDMTSIYDLFAQLAFVKKDGKVAWLTLNFLQKLIGWTRWDTKGSFENVQIGRLGS